MTARDKALKKSLKIRRRRKKTCPKKTKLLKFCKRNFTGKQKLNKKSTK